MISPRVRRTALLIAGRSLLLARTHCLSLLSAAILAGLAFVALSSDAFQTSRNAASQPRAPRPIAPTTVRSDYSLQQYTIGLAWTPPASAQEQAAAAAYFNDTTHLTPLERARLRPSRPKSTSNDTFPVTLPDATPQEQAEALLTALADAEALGLRLQLTDVPAQAQN
jgi:hypothetical protein